MCIKETRKILIELGIQLIYFFEVNFMTNFGFKTSDKCPRLCLYVLNMSYISTTLYILLKKQFNSFSDKRVFSCKAIFLLTNLLCFFSVNNRCVYKKHHLCEVIGHGPAFACSEETPLRSLSQSYFGLN